MKTFIKQIEMIFGITENQICETLHIHNTRDDTFVAVVCVRNIDNSFFHYEIIYKFKEMSKPKNYGYFVDAYNKDGDLVYKGFDKAFEEMIKYI